MLTQGIIIGIDKQLEINIYTLEKGLNMKDYIAQLDELTEIRS